MQNNVVLDFSFATNQPESEISTFLNEDLSIFTEPNADAGIFEVSQSFFTSEMSALSPLMVNVYVSFPFLYVNSFVSAEEA